MRLDVFQGADGQWYVRLVARNGETLMTSEAYTTKPDARQAANRIGRVTIPDKVRLVVIE